MNRKKHQADFLVGWNAVKNGLVKKHISASEAELLFPGCIVEAVINGCDDALSNDVFRFNLIENYRTNGC